VRRRRSGRLHLNAEINVVSLIDVMMLLLVIFMITAPLMQGGVDVKLPAADARPLENKSPLVITVDRNGRIFVDKDAVTYSEFAGTAKALLGKAKEGVTVRAGDAVRGRARRSRRARAGGSARREAEGRGVRRQPDRRARGTATGRRRE
jgi:biopolymer transport protein TolR